MHFRQKGRVKKENTVPELQIKNNYNFEQRIGLNKSKSCFKLKFLAVFGVMEPGLEV